MAGREAAVTNRTNHEGGQEVRVSAECRNQRDIEIKVKVHESDGFTLGRQTFRCLNKTRVCNDKLACNIPFWYVMAVKHFAVTTNIYPSQHFDLNGYATAAMFFSEPAKPLLFEFIPGKSLQSLCEGFSDFLNGNSLNQHILSSKRLGSMRFQLGLNTAAAPEGGGGGEQACRMHSPRYPPPPFPGTKAGHMAKE